MCPGGKQPIGHIPIGLIAIIGILVYAEVEKMNMGATWKAVAPTLFDVLPVLAIIVIATLVMSVPRRFDLPDEGDDSA